MARFVVIDSGTLPSDERDDLGDQVREANRAVVPRPFRKVSAKPRMHSGVDPRDSKEMKQRGQSQEAPIVISPRDVARLLKELFAHLRSRRNVKPRETEWRSRGGSR